MKAILVIDISSHNEKNYYAEIHIKHKQSHKKVKTFAHCNLKPIPQKKDWKIGYVKDNNTCEIFNKNYVDGWNDCIDEILGEEK